MPFYPTGETYVIHCEETDHSVTDYVVTPELIPEAAGTKMMVKVRFHVRCLKHPNATPEIDWH